MRRTVVIGGGASGLAASIAAAGKGADVTLVEQKELVGKKILSTGNGRCNLTNLAMSPEYYRGGNPDTVERYSILSAQRIPSDFSESWEL